VGAVNLGSPDVCVGGVKWVARADDGLKGKVA
jgi:hypothetical protein